MIINYFPHDSNARSDNKIIALRMKYGWEGYGLFWAIIEKLRDSAEYRLAADYDAIAYDLRADAKAVQGIINDFGLFSADDQGRFYSPSLLRRMEVKDDRSARSREAALARWHGPRCTGNADAMPAQSGGTAAAIPEKESKPVKSKSKSLYAPPTAAQREDTEREIFEIFLRDRRLAAARDETQRLLDYYDSRGWQSGATRITDPGAAARLWEPHTKAAPLAEQAALTLETIYRVLSQTPGFSWRKFAVSGASSDPQNGKLLLSCSRAFGDLAHSSRAALIEAVNKTGSAGFRLIYNDQN